VTDSGSEIRLADDKPGIANLLNIMSAVTDRPVADLENEFAGKGYGDFKAAVADAVIARLEPVQKQFHTLMENKDYLHDVLKTGAESAQVRAWKMLSKVYRKTGFLDRRK